MKNEILDILLLRNLINENDIREAIKAQGVSGKSILDILVLSKKARAEDVADAIAEHYGLERIEFLGEINPPAIVPPDLLKKHQVFPIKVEDNVLYLAMGDPSNIEINDIIGLATGLNIMPVVCTAKEIDRAIQKHFGTTSNSYAEEDYVEEGYNEELAEVLNSPAVTAVQEIIDSALADNISDIHIEPTKDKLTVRFRQDGILKIFRDYPKRLYASVASRIKVMAGLNITERRVAQDGRIQLTYPREVDLRISTLPTIYGEKIVMRIFDKMRVIPDLESLGYDNEVLSVLRMATKSSYGMILATGPTGSGKTTTLYAILSRLISDEVNIVTVEDPPEYGIAGVNHVAVNPKTGMTFANILRAVLRQDPDIIMLGEIRDSETARVAVQAAMTGHLVLSTLHTNNAASAPVRLIDMGVEPYLVASSLLAVVAQRLVRKVCPQCKQKLPVEKGSPTHTFLGNVSHAITAPGCYHCSYTGYSGRTAIAEILPISPSIRDLIRKNSPSGEIQKCAVNEGMEPLVKKAQGKVKECLITAEEAIKNVFSGWEEEA